MVLCGCSQWLIITIILNLIGRLTEQKRSEEADVFSEDSGVKVHVCVVCVHKELTRVTTH